MTDPNSVNAIIALAQTLDNSGEFEAADIVDSTVTESKHYDLSKLRQALEDLDFALTGNSRHERERPKSDKDILETLYDGREYYLNDGGYSRVVLKPSGPDYDRLHAFYTSNSTNTVKNAWESAVSEIQAVEAEANELYNDEAYNALTMS